MGEAVGEAKGLPYESSWNGLVASEFVKGLTTGVGVGEKSSTGVLACPVGRGVTVTFFVDAQKMALPNRSTMNRNRLTSILFWVGLISLKIIILYISAGKKYPSGLTKHSLSCGMIYL